MRSISSQEAGMSAQTIHELVPTTTETRTRPGLPRQRSVPPERTSHLALVPEQPVRRPPAAPLGGVALTRRGRLVVLVALVALGAVLAFVVTGLVDGTAGTTAPSRPPTRSIVVQPGQTLWSIAREVAPSGDRRDVIARIVELNALPSTDVAAGTRLAVPTR
jgi:LysM repeat protein